MFEKCKIAIDDSPLQPTFSYDLWPETSVSADMLMM
jgi:hypothetical protein